MRIPSSPVASVRYSASLSILTSPIILHVWHLISSWPLTLKLSSSLRIWCHLKFKFLGPSAQPRSCHMGNRPPLAWQRSACATGPTVIVLLAHLVYSTGLILFIWPWHFWQYFCGQLEIYRIESIKVYWFWLTNDITVANDFPATDSSEEVIVLKTDLGETSDLK